MDKITAVYLADIREAARVDSSELDENDAQIKRAVIVFVRAEFGIENADREKYLQSFESIKLRLALSAEYKEA